MKQKENVWYFESYQEIRNYLAQGFDRLPHFIYLTTRQCAHVRGDGTVVADTNEYRQPYVFTEEDLSCKYHYLDRVVSREHTIRSTIGSIEDFPATDYAVNQVWKVVELSADTALQGFYKAGEHLAEHLLTVGQDRTQFTTKELTATKNAVELVPVGDVHYLYRITTKTGCYQCFQDSLWFMVLAMEKAGGVGPARRKLFTILKKDAEQRNHVLHLSFVVDKDVSRIKQCLATDERRPMLTCPVIETATGVIVGSNGHILAAHKLSGYEIDLQSGLPVFTKGLMSIPKEVCQMKGRVTVDVVEGTWKDESGYDVSGIIITATDAGGRQAVVRQSDCYPNWRSVIPQEIGPAVAIDTQAVSDGVKRIMPQLNDMSERFVLSATAGDMTMNLSGEDYDFSKCGNVTVELPGKVPCDMMISLNASLVITAMGFSTDTMHYKGAQHAIMFLGASTLTMQMPMLIDEKFEGPKPADKQMKRFDVGKWIDGKSTVAKKTKSAVRKVASKDTPLAAHPAVSSQPSFEDRLRAALKKQLAMAA